MLAVSYFLGGAGEKLTVKMWKRAVLKLRYYTKLAHVRINENKNASYKDSTVTCVLRFLFAAKPYSTPTQHTVTSINDYFRVNTTVTDDCWKRSNPCRPCSS